MPYYPPAGSGSGTVEAIAPGNNIDVDATDPANPIVAVETLTLADISDVTASAAELNTLDGITASLTELNYIDGVTSAIQTQIDTKATGPASATDDAVARFDGTTGKLLQNSPATLTDGGTFTITSPTGYGTSTVIGENAKMVVTAGGDGDSTNYIQSGNVAFSGNVSLKLTGYFSNLGSNLFLKFANTLIGGDAAGATSVLQVVGPISTAYAAKTASYTVLATDSVLTGDCTSGNLTFTLPTAASITGRRYIFKRIDASANSVIIDGSGAQTIDGAATKTLTTQHSCIVIISNGTNWVIESQIGTIT